MVNWLSIKGLSLLFILGAAIFAGLKFPLFGTVFFTFIALVIIAAVGFYGLGHRTQDDILGREYK